MAFTGQVSMQTPQEKQSSAGFIITMNIASGIGSLNLSCII